MTVNISLINNKYIINVKLILTLIIIKLYEMNVKTNRKYFSDSVSDNIYQNYLLYFRQ